MFDVNNFEKLLPNYLRSDDKNRLKVALEQFLPKNESVDYNDFFLDEDKHPGYFLQGDLLKEVKIIDWDDEINDYYSGYSDVMLISNTCDVSIENQRSTNKKQSILAPIISVSEYFDDLKNYGFSKDRIASYYNSLKKQEFSNLIFIPQNTFDGNEYIVFLDKLVWHPTSSLINKIKDLKKYRICTLSNIGFYIMILKVSYHFCRLPEEIDRDF